MTAPRYRPQADSLPDRVCRWLLRAGGDTLSSSDIATKFDVVSRGSIKTQLESAIANGLVTYSRTPLEGTVYAAGSALAAAYEETAEPAHAPAKPRTPACALPPADALQIEHGIPIPPRAVGITSPYAALFERMDVGDSIRVPTAQAARRLTELANRLGKAAGRKYTTRTVGDCSRVWRTA